MNRPQKITFRQMRWMGVRGLLVYLSDYRCSRWNAISGDGWPDDVRLSDVEPRCTVPSMRPEDWVWAHSAAFEGARSSGAEFTICLI